MAAVLAVGAGFVYGALDVRSTVPGTPVAPAQRFAVAVDRPTDIHLDPRWSIHVPAGGVRTASTLTVRPVVNADGPVGSTSLAAAMLTLSSGQPTAPWTFTWQQDRPVPAGQVLYLLDDTGDGVAYAGPNTTEPAPASVHPAIMSPDRRSGTVEIEHLSFLDWLTDAASVISNTLGRFFGQRATPPDCPGKRPAWLSSAVFLEDRNAPMLVCVGSDPKKPDLAVVKVVNNRGGALLVTTPAAPDWAWQSIIGAEMESWAPNLLTHVVEYLGVPRAEATRTWVLPPGQEVDLGFSRARLGTRSPTEILGRYSPTSIAFGLASKAVSEVLDEQSRGWDFIVMGACLESLTVRTIDDHGPTGIALGVASLARCVIEQPETLIQTMRKLLPGAVWQSMSGKVYRTANVAKKALTRYLIVAEASFTLADVVTTLALPRAAFTISLYPRAAPTRTVKTTVITIVGVNASGGPAPGFHVETTGDEVNTCNSSPASHDPGIVACAPSAAGADVCWVQPDRSTLLCGGMPWEKTLYQHRSDQPVSTASAADYEVSPWGLELAGGLKCRLRNGGSWGGRADGYVGAYSCGNDTQYVLATANEPMIDQTKPQWTVKVGQLGGDGDTFPPPRPVVVTTAYYAGMP
jgi:hypothetical protein